MRIYDYFSQGDAKQPSKIYPVSLDLGFSLIEVLIVLVLSLVILQASIEIYGLIKKAHERQRSSKNASNNERTALQFFLDDLYACGYRGRRTQDPHFPLKQIYQERGPYQYLRFDRAVSMFTAMPGHCYGKLPLESCQALQENTDVLIIYNIPQIITQLKQPMRDLDSALLIDDGRRIREKALVLISDNEMGDAFVANQVQHGTLFHDVGANKTAALSKRYDVNADIIQLDTVAYYLKDNALMRDDLLLRSEEILKGVKDFKVQLKGESGKNQEISSVNLRLTSIDNQVWNYEIAIRNRYGIHRGIDIVDIDLAAMRTSSLAGALDIQILP